jgi:hypothetical protein
MDHRHRTLAAVAASVVLLGSACGGSGRLSKADYQAQVQAVARDLRAASAGLGPGLEAKPLREEQHSLDRAASTLENLKPPKDAERDNREIAAGLRGTANIFGSLAAAKDDAARARAALQALARSGASRRVQRALDDLKRKGYDVGLFGRSG